MESLAALQLLEGATAVSESDFIDLMTETLQSRQSYAWSQSIPMGTAVGIHFATLVTSPSTSSVGLVSIAQLVLIYIRDAQGLNKENDNRDAEDLADTASMFAVFEAVFQRIISIKYDRIAQPVVESFYNTVWKFHTKSEIDFSESTVIKMLLQKRPRFLEPLFIESLRRWNPALLAPICSQHNYSFQIILDYLRQSYETSPVDRVLKYVDKFLEATNRHLETAASANAEGDPNNPPPPAPAVKSGTYPLLIPLYPAPLHPILTMIVQLQTVNISEKTSKALTTELLGLMNEIFGYSPEERPMISFILKLYEPTRKILQMTEHKKIKLKTYPFLWQVLNNLPTPNIP